MGALNMRVGRGHFGESEIRDISLDDLGLNELEATRSSMEKAKDKARNIYSNELIPLCKKGDIC